MWHSNIQAIEHLSLPLLSQIQQHSFNCPYQAGSPKLLPNCNTADDAEVYELGLQAGDIIGAYMTVILNPTPFSSFVFCGMNV